MPACKRVVLRMGLMYLRQCAGTNDSELRAVMDASRAASTQAVPCQCPYARHVSSRVDHGQFGVWKMKIGIVVSFCNIYKTTWSRKGCALGLEYILFGVGRILCA